MKIDILNHEYDVVDAKEKVTIADSFVVRQNKIGIGNGEAKLYVGNDNEELRSFFGPSDFQVKCFLLKKDLVAYLEENKTEYQNPDQPYRNRDLLPELWKLRMDKVLELPEILPFTISEQGQLDGPRVYVKSEDEYYNLLRELSLPNISYISIVRIKDFEGDGDGYYFKLFSDYFDEYVNLFAEAKIEKEVEASNIANSEKINIIRARVGQGEYRKKLLELCPFCPLTMVSDERVLIASHIRPWAKSDNQERIDPYNGFMFTPNIDWLFDKGFLSFTDDKKIILSPFLSNMTYSKLGVSDGKLISMLPVEGRELYLKYHRENILKR